MAFRLKSLTWFSSYKKWLNVTFISQDLKLSDVVRARKNSSLVILFGLSGFHSSLFHGSNSHLFPTFIPNSCFVFDLHNWCFLHGHFKNEHKFWKCFGQLLLFKHLNVNLNILCPQKWKGKAYLNYVCHPSWRNDSMLHGQGGIHI